MVFLYGGCSGVDTKKLKTDLNWMSCVTFLCYLFEEFFNPLNIMKLITFNTGSNERDIVFCMGLFHVPVNIPTAFNFGPKRWRPTIKHSKLSVFKFVYSKTSIAKAIKLRNTERSLRNIDDHPIIYGIGESIDEIFEFFVVMGDIIYEFKSFIEALDASFKIYKVLKRKYAKESSKFWNFIDLAFYKIQKNQNPSLVAVMNSLQTE